MIKILKKGKIQKLKKLIYKTTCQACGCEFEFEAEDIKAQEKHPGGTIIVECPCCHKDIIQPSFKFDTRLAEVAIEGND